MTILSTSIHVLILIVVIQIIFESHPSILSIKNFMNSARSSQGPHDIHARLLTIHLPLTRSQVSSMVSVIIESFKTSKSPGFDNITLAVKLTSKAIVAPLTELIHACIRKGAVPMAWKSTQVTPVCRCD